MAKAKKQRADKYEKPLKIEGTFGDVIKVAMSNSQKSDSEKLNIIKDALSELPYLDSEMVSKDISFQIGADNQSGEFTVLYYTINSKLKDALTKEQKTEIFETVVSQANKLGISIVGPPSA